MRFEIVIDDADRHDPDAAETGTPWNAALFPISDDGESGDLIIAGYGATPQEAVASLLEGAPDNWEEEA